MSEEGFEQLECALESGGAAAAFAFLEKKLRDEKNYALLFEAMVMKKRHELQLPLIPTGLPGDAPADMQPMLDEAYVAAAREVGGLFLADGDIPAAWPYFRAIGESEPVAAAIEEQTAREGIEPVIEIALTEGVHPYKGFQLILEQFGLCRAMTLFEQYPVRKDREKCAALIIRTLHAELLEALKRTIARSEAKAPESQNISELIAGRDWLFGEYDSYIDATHLTYAIRLSAELKDRKILELGVELADYGQHLSQHFRYPSDPPFEDTYGDYGIFLRALLGEKVDAAIAHFRNKVTASQAGEIGSAPAQVLVGLLARLERFQEAIDVSLEHLRQARPGDLACPSIFQLCQLAGDFEQLRRVSRERQDPLNFTAATLQRQKGQSRAPQSDSRDAERGEKE